MWKGAPSPFTPCGGRTTTRPGTRIKSDQNRFSVTLGRSRLGGGFGGRAANTPTHRAGRGVFFGRAGGHRFSHADDGGDGGFNRFHRGRLALFARLAGFTRLARFTPLARLAARTVLVGIARCAVFALVAGLVLALVAALPAIVAALLVVALLPLLGLTFAILVLGRHFGLILGRGRQVLRTALAVILVIGVDQTEIMFRMLIEILGGMTVALAGGVTGQAQIFSIT